MNPIEKCSHERERGREREFRNLEIKRELKIGKQMKKKKLK